MRYLHPTDLVSTLRRGKSIEQFLGGGRRENAAILRCIEIRPTPDGFEVWLHEPEDLGNDQFLDLYESIDPTTLPMRVERTAEEAVAIAHTELGADMHNWVNLGVAQDDYRDFIAAGRLPGWRKAAV
jgi:hypothetical protein